MVHIKKNFKNKMPFKKKKKKKLIEWREVVEGKLPPESLYFPSHLLGEHLLKVERTGSLNRLDRKFGEGGKALAYDF